MTTLSPAHTLQYTEQELLSLLVQDAADGRTPLALWREPGAAVKHLIISENFRLMDQPPLEELESGFLVAPFEKSRQRLFLPADLFFTFENGKLRSDAGSREEKSTQWLRDKLRDATPPGRVRLPHSGATPPSGQRDKQAFMELIEAGIRAIERGSFEKVVPSRTTTVRLSETFDIIHAFQRLCDSYPGALISFVNIPGVGSWLGASPELLVSLQDKTLFKTVALAGTLPYHAGLNVRSVAWTQKEIEEQALVERYVISCFKKIRLREYEEYGPKTVIAGNLLHLKSEFTVDMTATNFPQLGSVMLDLLHPTSAVCGMPLDTALEFLRQHEQYERGFYAGYLGPVNINNNTALFVNLRCLQLLGDEAVLYAGAGVTIDSVPEQEWAETEMKFNTLLNVIL